ncbi:MAG: toprim domain-containing protein [Anaerolineales bacterium]
MKTLVIVESPVKARLVGRYARPVLGKDTTVRACFGHLRDLPEGELGIDVAQGFLPCYVIQPKREDLVRELRAEIRAAGEIYLATDPDREGEAIAWHVCQVFKAEMEGKEVWRATFHEVTERAVQGALKNPRRLDIRLVQAAVARRVMDRLVGYIVSPVLWKHVKGKDLSAGRVQTAALRILAEAERTTSTMVEIEL